MDAQQYDETRARQRRTRIILIALVVLVCGWVFYHLRNYSERRAVDNFFAAIQRQDYESAYAIWFHDPDWKQHQQKYSNYQFNDFYRDWGPGGEWGLVKSHAVDCSYNPGGGSGVIVQVTVNHRAEHAFVWVQKSDRTLSFSPSEIECGNWMSWITE